MKTLISEGEAPEHSYSTSRTRTSGMGSGGGGGGMLATGNPMGVFALVSMNMSRSTSTTKTVNLKRAPLRDEIFDALGPEQAVCILNWSNCRRKSIIELDHIFFEKAPDVVEALKQYHNEQTQGGAA
jgi:hypothetical protein